MKKQLIIELISGVLFAMFIFTSVHKMYTFDQSTWDMNAQPIPNWMTPFLIWGLLLIHVGIAACLMFERARLKGLYATAALLLSYTLYVGAVMMNAFGFIPCSCTWILKSMSYWQTLGFDIFFFLLAGSGIVLVSKGKQFPQKPNSLSTESQVSLPYKLKQS